MIEVVSAVLSAVLQVVILGGVPLAIYSAWQKLRHHRSFREIRERAGLVLGDTSTLRFALGFAFLLSLSIVLFPPPLEHFLESETSPQKPMIGLGWSPQAWVIALSYGIFQNGFTEELLFRGLLAGALHRRMSLWAANLVQALIFFLPHLAMVVFLAPSLWMILPGLLIGSLIMGWQRMKSGSILGAWIMHAAANTTTCMFVAVQSV